MSSATGETAASARETASMHRVEEQVRGIERMVADATNSIDFLMQVAAVNTALEARALRVDDHVNHCVTDRLAARDRERARQKGRELLEAVQRFARIR